MQKKVLTEVDLYCGSIDMPKGFEINRKKIADTALESFSKGARVTNNRRSYEYEDYQLPYSQPLQWVQDYLRDHWNLEYHYTLVEKNLHVKLLRPKTKSFLRNHVDPLDLRNAPDYTFIYAVDVEPDSFECIVEYDDNRRKGRTWHVPLKNNDFVMFPSTQKYMFTENKSNKLNIIVVINYEYI